MLVHTPVASTLMPPIFSGITLFQEKNIVEPVGCVFSNPKSLTVSVFAQKGAVCEDARWFFLPHHSDKNKYIRSYWNHWEKGDKIGISETSLGICGIGKPTSHGPPRPIVGISVSRCVCVGRGERGEKWLGGQMLLLCGFKLFSFCVESWTLENDVNTFYQRFTMFHILSQCYFVYNFYNWWVFDWICFMSECVTFSGYVILVWCNIWVWYILSWCNICITWAWCECCQRALSRSASPEMILTFDSAFVAHTNCQVTTFMSGFICASNQPVFVLFLLNVSWDQRINLRWWQ